MAARAFLFIFKHSGLESFTLHTVQDMLPTFNTWMSVASGVFGRFTRFIRYMGDIKEMFTRLPHDKIMPAVDFVLDLCASTARGRSRSVRVEKRRRGSVQFDRTSTHLFPQFANMTFAEIRRVILVDVSSCLFKSFGLLLLNCNSLPTPRLRFSLEFESWSS